MPVWTSADLICATVHVGWRCLSSAARPAMCGLAMLVPENVFHVPSPVGTDERMSAPGAVTSGFISADTGVGPREEKEAITPVLLDAATVIADGAFPAEPTEPRPKSSKSFP